MSVSVLSSNLRVTGSPIVYVPNLSGQGNVTVSLVGNTVLISGLASTGGGGGGTGGGVTALNGLVGSVIVTGTGTNTAFTLGGLIYVSGSNVDSLNLSGALGASGSYLYGLTIGLSGQVAATYATIANLQSTGQTLYNDLLGLSGVQNAGLVATGTLLYGYIVGMSGWATSTFATQTSLALTGSNLYGYTVGLSGQVNSALTLTGSNLLTLILSQSGFNASTYATILNLAATGQNLYNLIVGESGLFVPTGSILSMLTGVPTGVDTFFAWYSGYTFSTVPRVVVTWETSFFPVLYGVAVSGRTTSGCYILLTDTVLETGCAVNLIIKS